MTAKYKGKSSTEFVEFKKKYKDPILINEILFSIAFFNATLAQKITENLTKYITKLYKLHR